MIDTRADDHNIVCDCETALAANPLAIPVLDPAVRKHGGFIHIDAFLVNMLRVRQLFRWEEVPYRFPDDFIWGITKDVDDRVGAV